jgi:maleamate amidohydrolase
MKAVLVVVDMLNDFFERSEVLAAQRARLVAATNSVVRGFRSRELPVIWIRQEFASDLHDAFSEMRSKNVSITIAGTPGCEILSELEVLETDSIIVKKRYSAFFGTNFADRAYELRPEFIVIAGVNTHACVRMTAIDAYRLDYQVVVAADCVASSIGVFQGSRWKHH